MAFNVHKFQQKIGEKKYQLLVYTSAIMAAFLALRFISLLFGDPSPDAFAVLNRLPYAAIVVILVIYIAALNLSVILITNDQLMQQLSPPS